MLITDQVVTAPCTYPIQERFQTFEAMPVLRKRTRYHFNNSKNAPL